MSGRELRKICIEKLHEMMSEIQKKERVTEGDCVAYKALGWATSTLKNVQEEMVAKELTSEEADCIMHHIQALLDQSTEGRVANFGEPCAKCEHIEECRADWLTKIKAVINRSSVGIELNQNQRG